MSDLTPEERKVIEDVDFEIGAAAPRVPGEFTAQEYADVHSMSRAGALSRLMLAASAGKLTTRYAFDEGVHRTVRVFSPIPKPEKQSSKRNSS